MSTKIKSRNRQRFRKNKLPASSSLSKIIWIYEYVSMFVVAFILVGRIEKKIKKYHQNSIIFIISGDVAPRDTLYIWLS